MPTTEIQTNSSKKIEKPLHGQFTTSNGNPVDDDQNSMTAGPRGGVLLQDFHLIDKLAHFNRERVPERVVHAKGAGAHGYFEVTKDISHLCKAKLFQNVGKRTPVFTRFSTVGGESGSADVVRDPRGFAVKFYTEEGNWDFVGNNTPVFFIRDAIKFPDFIHTQKRNPQTHLKDNNMFWDFLSLTPESIHQVTILFSNRGTPDGFRHMDGFYGHTLKLVNEKGDIHYVKFHFKSNQGIKNLKNKESVEIAGSNPDYSTQDLFEAIERGEPPSWTLKVQIMKPEDVATYRFDPFDVTKVWPHSDYPLTEVGHMVLDRNPQNYFAETEQVAFSPSNMPPGIEPTPDRMLQGRLFGYADAHRYRLGTNFSQIPINCPYATKVYNYQRDGAMTVNGNHGSLPNYYPNDTKGEGKVSEDLKNKNSTPISSTSVGTGKIPGEFTGKFGRKEEDSTNYHARYTQPLEDDDYVQAGNLYKTLSKEEQSDLIENIVGHLGEANQVIQKRMIEIFKKAHPEYGQRVEQSLAKSN